MDKVRLPLQALDLVRLNEAAPVIGDTAMETITETIITESSMIGHNPATPAGAGRQWASCCFSKISGKENRACRTLWQRPAGFPMRKRPQG